MWFWIIVLSVIAIFSSSVIMLVFKQTRVAGKILLTLDSFCVIAFGTLFAALMIAFSGKNLVVYNVILLLFSILLLAVICYSIWSDLRKKGFYITTVSCIVLCILFIGSYEIYQRQIDKIPTVGESDNVLMHYVPYGEESLVATLDEKSTLTLEDDIPKMDGATALYPIYSAFAKAVYPRETLEDNDRTYLDCSTTTGAYEKIVTGESDIIFVAGASENQIQFAKDRNVKLEFTPIGKEAFVFFVNSKNSMDSIDFEEIRGIYSGEITDWNQLGVKGLGKIKAFQRDEGSGSQSALKRMMSGKELMDPPKDDIVAGMGGIIERTADYRNFKNAIGYSFRFYSTSMISNNQIKLLSVNGVYPSIENIENGTYPISSSFYAVTRSDASENTKKLVEWVLSEQGQRLIEDTGYTPILKSETVNNKKIIQ